MLSGKHSRVYFLVNRLYDIYVHGPEAHKARRLDNIRRARRSGPCDTAIAVESSIIGSFESCEYLQSFLRLPSVDSVIQRIAFSEDNIQFDAVLCHRRRS